MPYLPVYYSVYAICFHLSATSAILAGVMGQRAISSGKFMPAGLVATLRLILYDYYTPTKSDIHVLCYFAGFNVSGPCYLLV